ncbi:MAG: hypothetical protein JSU86_04855 [Phycisphaerales bacterium]|nr:MAG: hypothetical protein JSU86_04855 [Phycisphaerales bacterium]
MIRKVIIVVLTLGAVGTVSVATTTVWTSLVWRYRLSDLTTVRFAVKGSVLNATYDAGPGQTFDMLGARLLMPRTLTRLGVQPTAEGSFLSLPAFHHGAFSLPLQQVQRWAELRLPLWLPFILFATYPTVAFVHGPVRRYRRRRKGLCIRCGYNLTGNMSGVCPECGEPT